MVIVWTQQAWDSLREIYKFHAADLGDVKARRIVEDILRAPQHLATFPLAGSAAMTVRQKEYRQVVTKRHKIYYTVEAEQETIHIHLVWDTRRDPKRLRTILMNI